MHGRGNAASGQHEQGAGVAHGQCVESGAFQKEGLVPGGTGSLSTTRVLALEAPTDTGEPQGSG